MQAQNSIVVIKNTAASKACPYQVQNENCTISKSERTQLMGNGMTRLNSSARLLKSGKFIIFMPVILN